MADRFLLKQFAQNATNTGVFGSYQAGNPTYSNDPAEIQSLPAWFSGWLDATTNGTFLPRLEEMQGLQKVLCQAIIENYREGVPVWIAGESYYKNSVVSYEGDDGFALYYNLTGSYNNSTPDVDTTNWANLASLFVTKEYLDNNFLGINRVTNSVLSDQDNSSFSSQSNVAFVNQGATVTDNVASGFSRYGTILLTKSMLTSTDWSFVFSFQSPDVTTKQSLVAMPTLVSGLGIENGHLFFGMNTGTLVEGTFPLAENALYIVRMKFDGSQYTVEIATDTGSFNTDITVEKSQQPFAGKTISLGNGGADFADNYFRGSLRLNTMTIKDGDDVYWNVSTLSNINLIHFDGVYSVIAPNGRGADNNLNNLSYTTTLNNYLNYSLANGQKTILLKQDGEIMVRKTYIESSQPPSTANSLDVWFNPDTNIMYEFSSQQPNFTNKDVPVNDGIATSFAEENYININTSISPLSKITLSVNTSGDVTTRQDYYSWGNSSLYIQNGDIYYDTKVTGYAVGINTGTSTEPEWTEIGYVPVNGNGILEEGTQVYSDTKCSEEMAVASGTDYSYIGTSGFEVVSCQLPIAANQVYFVDCGYIGEKYTLMVGTAVSEVSSMVQTPDANLLHINGLEPLTGSANPIKGTVNLANIDLVTWQWNGVSHVATDWNRIVAGKLGTVTDNGTQITSLSMDKPLQLAKQTDLAQFQKEVDSRIIDITNKWVVVPTLPSNPNPDVFYFIPEV